MPSTPMIGSSPICWMLRMSAIGTSPSRTARSCSGPLKPSWPPDFTSISTAPEVPALTSSAKLLALMVWKLPSGQTVARRQLHRRLRLQRLPARRACPPIPAPAFKAVLRPNL